MSNHLQLLFILGLWALVVSPGGMANSQDQPNAITQGAYQGALPQHLAYLTSWQLPNSADDTLQYSKADAYLLAFARWNDEAEILSSDNIIRIPPANPDILPTPYATWTTLAHKHPDTKFLISFGGPDYDDIWERRSFTQNTDQLAKSIAALLRTKFPVYQVHNCDLTLECLSDDDGPKMKRKIVDYVELDGVDFDFEHRKRLTRDQNSRMIKLAEKVREFVGNSKIIALTTYHVAADPIDCQKVNVLKKCSFTEQPRSIHHGEVLATLHATKHIVDIYNVMVYDAGLSFDFKTAMNNYYSVLGTKHPLRLGVSINQQWGNTGPFVMPVAENNARVRWANDAGFGGFFVWAIGATTESRSLDSQVEIFNNFSKLFNNDKQ